MICLEPMNLMVSQRMRGDLLAMPEESNNKAFRHSGYRQFIFWRHGKLGLGNRKVIPSCCVWAIRRKFPSLNGLYTGYKEARPI